MIPTRASDAQHESYVSNILRAWELASSLDLTEGHAWYPVANGIARTLGNGNVRLGAGVIAALSPQKAWHLNVLLATAACNGNAHGHMRDALRKAEAIRAGADPLDVLPAHVKTWHFFRNINDPTDPDPITIDRHAHDVAVGARYGSRDRGLGNVTRYATLAHSYREAARQLGELPNVVQAVTWCAIRRTNQLATSEV